MSARPLLLAIAVMLAAPAPLWAANAEQPYQNVDKRNDAGNDTGNNRVDTLNRGQLDANQKAPAPAGPATPGK